MQVGERIKKSRIELGMSATELAIKTGKGESAIRMWESGKSKPDLDTLIKLTEYFNCSADYLLGLSEHKNEEDKKATNEHEDEIYFKIRELPKDKREAFYKAINNVFFGYTEVAVSRQIHESYFKNLINILESYGMFAIPVLISYKIQNLDWDTAHANKEKIKKLVKDMPLSLLESRSIIINSVDNFYLEMNTLLDFMFKGEINGEKQVKTTVSELFADIDEILKNKEDESNI